MPDTQDELNALQGRIRALTMQRDALAASLRELAVHGPVMTEKSPAIPRGYESTAGFYAAYITRMAADVQAYARRELERAGL